MPKLESPLTRHRCGQVTITDHQDYDRRLFFDHVVSLEESSMRERDEPLAGFEASGTSNMKFMMNGALTVGTRDGATIEMAQEAGDDNLFLFGPTSDQVSRSRGWYNPWWHYHHEPEARRALDMIASNVFRPHEPGIFAPICDTLLTRGDHDIHLADLASYVRAQEQVAAVYLRPDDRTRRAIINIAHSGKFSSDRTIAEYARDIWEAERCPID